MSTVGFRVSLRPQASGDGSDESAGENDMVAWWMGVDVRKSRGMLGHGGDWNIGEMYGIMMVNDG